MISVLDLRPLCAALLTSQLLAAGQVFKNYVMLAPQYEPEKLKDELTKGFQGCLLPNIPIEFIPN